MIRLERQLCAAVTSSLSGAKVRPPEAGLILWNMFQRLSAARTYHMAGPNPLQFAEIEAYCRLMRLPLEPHHLRILMAMDQAWLGSVYAKARAPEGIKTLPPISQHAISAALMDANFG